MVDLAMYTCVFSYFQIEEPFLLSSEKLLSEAQKCSQVVCNEGIEDAYVDKMELLEKNYSELKILVSMWKNTSVVATTIEKALDPIRNAPDAEINSLQDLAKIMKVSLVQ